ncbi:MAG: NUDIX hydrolase [Desulfurococcaceae archaeon]
MDSPRLIEEKTLYKGLRFNVVRRLYEKADNGIFERDIVVFPQAVVVLPFISEEEVLLIRQFRAPLNDFIIEAPAGVIDSGESPEEAAYRELLEETGYYPGKLVKIGEFTPAPGYSTELLHFFYAKDLVYKGARPEKYEIIRTFKVNIKEAYRMVIENEIRDMKTALLILLYLSKHGERGEH